jgi:hypothetical protein
MRGLDNCMPSLWQQPERLAVHMHNGDAGGADTASAMREQRSSELLLHA